MPRAPQQTMERYALGQVQSLEELLPQLNSILARMTTRLDQMSGLNGTPTFHSAVDMRGQRIANVSIPMQPNDAVPNHMALTLAQDMGHNRAMQWNANGLQIFNLADGDNPQDTATVAQLRATRDELNFTAGKFITLKTDQTITGVKTFDLDPAAPFVVTSGSAKVDNLDADKWDGQEYTEDGFTATANGFTASITGSAQYAKAGGLVILFLPTLTGTSNTTTFTITGLPAAIQPTRTSHIMLWAADNSTDQLALVRLNAGSGTIDLYPTTGTLNWTNANIKTLYACMIPYALV